MCFVKRTAIISSSVSQLQLTFEIHFPPIRKAFSSVTMAASGALEALQRILPKTHFVLRGGGDYHTLNKDTYQAGVNVDLNPTCIFLPNNKRAVSLFLSTIQLFCHHI
ncbi:hypothetical protein HD806DRAFT_186763 [Xylariaceae sp. AK1471]|nr:hypothetical protein HD806DRAFT_186763 [Xylariaceae sp. AK1471]